MLGKWKRMWGNMIFYYFDRRKSATPLWAWEWHRWEARTGIWVGGKDGNLSGSVEEVAEDGSSWQTQTQ